MFDVNTLLPDDFYVSENNYRSSHTYEALKLIDRVTSHKLHMNHTWSSGLAPLLWNWNFWNNLIANIPTGPCLIGNDTLAVVRNLAYGPISHSSYDVKHNGPTHPWNMFHFLIIGSKVYRNKLSFNVRFGSIFLHTKGLPPSSFSDLVCLMFPAKTNAGMQLSRRNWTGVCLKGQICSRWPLDFT